MRIMKEEDNEEHRRGPQRKMVFLIKTKTAPKHGRKEGLRRDELEFVIAFTTLVYWQADDGGEINFTLYL